nr:hypothetical protein SHINE37_70155 [Rhizobiaceae bacterium]
MLTERKRSVGHGSKGSPIAVGEPFSFQGLVHEFLASFERLNSSINAGRRSTSQDERPGAGA